MFVVFVFLLAGALGDVVMVGIGHEQVQLLAVICERQSAACLNIISA